MSEDAQPEKKELHACIGCHFLAVNKPATTPNDFKPGRRIPLEVPLANRMNFQTSGNPIDLAVQSHRMLLCYMGVWLEHPCENVKPIWLTLERNEDCFFRKYHPGMAFEQARVLEEREANRREAEKDRALSREGLKLSRRAVWAAVAAIVLTLVWNILNTFIFSKPTAVVVEQRAPVETPANSQP